MNVQEAVADALALGAALGSLVSPTTLDVGVADDPAVGDSSAVSVALAVALVFGVAPSDMVAEAAGALAAITAEESRANNATVPIKVIRIRPGFMWLEKLRIGTLAFLLLLGLRIGARVVGLERRHGRPVTETNPTR